jgi:5-methylthioadenosine/S-adenosylhomocysteine deaminase
MEPMTASLLVKGGAVLTMDDDSSIHQPGWLYAEGDTIVEVGSGDPPARRVAADTVIDATGGAVMPGMVNAHTHLFQTFLRGLADDKPLLAWLEDAIWPAARHFTAADAEAAASIGLIENLRSGATSVIDHQYLHVDPAIDEAVCRVAERLGVRFLLARGWADRNYQPDLMESIDEILTRTAAVRDRFTAAGDMIRVESAPLIPWGCSDEAMRAVLVDAGEHGTGLHIHCAETEIEVEMNLNERGSRHVEWLADLGALSSTTQLAHSVWLDDGELDLIAETGAVVVHCPVSNMYLASGTARIVEMKRRGIIIALATDGPGSNNRQDMFEAMKTAVLLQKLTTGDATALLPEDALWMATRGGAAAFGLADRIGALEPGRAADLVVVDLASPFAAPVHSVSSALVFNASPGVVETVVVAGRVVIANHQLLVADEEAELVRGGVACDRLLSRAGIQSDFVGNRGD